MCSSSFISREWTLATFAAYPTGTGPADARGVASLYSQALLFICEMGQEAMNSAIVSNLFTSSTHLKASSSADIEQQLQRIIASISNQTPQMATQFFNVLTFAMMGEQFINAYGSNAVVYISPYAANQLLIAGSKYELPDGSKCSCETSLSCEIPAAIFHEKIDAIGSTYFLNVSRTSIKGMQMSCYPFNGFLKSTLECYYDSACIALLVPNASTFSPLDSISPTRFSPTSTFQDMVNQLMVENLFFHHSAANLYEICAPLTCNYAYMHRNTILSIITCAVGLISGLNTIFRLIIPIFVDSVSKIKAKILELSARRTRTTLGFSIRGTKQDDPGTGNIDYT